MTVMGRPKKEVTRDKRITIRLTESEYTRLNEHAKKQKKICFTNNI